MKKEKELKNLWTRFIKETQYVVFPDSKGIKLETIAIDFAKFVLEQEQKDDN